MRKDILNKTFILFTFIAFTSCKAKKAALPPVTPVAPAAAEKPIKNSNAEIIAKLQAKQPAFNTLSIKAKGELKIDGKGQDVNMSIRIKNGEAIWVSVSMVIEGVRALITPDSIKIMHRLDNIYIRKPFSYIYQFTNKQVDFKAIQGLLTANAFPQTLSPSAEFSSKDNQTEVKGALAGLVYHLLFNSNNNLIQNNITDQNNGQNLNVSYADFGSIKSLELPQTVNINSEANNKKISIALNYNSITADEPVDFPFNVPKRYTVKD